MRVWVDGLALTGRTSGVQRYTEGLLRALLDVSPGIDLRAFRFVDDRRARDSLPLAWRTAAAHRRAHAFLSDYLVVPPLELLLRTRPGIFFFPSFRARPVSRLSRSVVVIYDLSFFNVPQFHEERFAASLRNSVPRSVALADTVVTISEFSRREIVERFPRAADRTTVIFPGVDARFTPPAPQRLARFRERSGLATPYLLFVGTKEPRKNIDGVLDAYDRLSPELRARAPLVIAGGKGWKDERLRARLAAASIRELDYVDDDDLPLLYAGARALVFPSFYEGFGLPPLEAMACGTPVIVSSTTALPEVAGDAGLLVSPHDVDDIAAAMRRVIEDDALIVTLRAKSVAQAARFSWQRSAQQLLAVFERL